MSMDKRSLRGRSASSRSSSPEMLKPKEVKIPIKTKALDVIKRLCGVTREHMPDRVNNKINDFNVSSVNIYDKIKNIHDDILSLEVKQEVRQAIGYLATKFNQAADQAVHNYSHGSGEQISRAEGEKKMQDLYKELHEMEENVEKLIKALSVNNSYFDIYRAPFTDKQQLFLYLNDQVIKTTEEAYKQVLKEYQESSNSGNQPDVREHFEKGCDWLEKRPSDLKKKINSIDEILEKRSENYKRYILELRHIKHDIYGSSFYGYKQFEESFKQFQTDSNEWRAWKKQEIAQASNPDQQRSKLNEFMKRFDELDSKMFDILRQEKRVDYNFKRLVFSDHIREEWDKLARSHELLLACPDIDELTKSYRNDIDKIRKKFFLSLQKTKVLDLMPEELTPKQRDFLQSKAEELTSKQKEILEYALERKEPKFLWCKIQKFTPKQRDFLLAALHKDLSPDERNILKVKFDNFTPRQCDFIQSEFLKLTPKQLKALKLTTEELRTLEIPSLQHKNLQDNDQELSPKQVNALVDAFLKLTPRQLSTLNINPDCYKILRRKAYDLTLADCKILEPKFLNLSPERRRELECEFQERKFAESEFDQAYECVEQFESKLKTFEQELHTQRLLSESTEDDWVDKDIRRKIKYTLDLNYSNNQNDGLSQFDQLRTEIMDLYSSIKCDELTYKKPGSDLRVSFLSILVEEIGNYTNKYSYNERDELIKALTMKG